MNADITEEHVYEHSVFHYSETLDDCCYFRTRFNSLMKALEEREAGYYTYDSPVFCLEFGSEHRTVRSFILHFSEHLIRACRNPMYWDNGEFTDLLFYWYSVCPIMRRIFIKNGMSISSASKIMKKISCEKDVDDFFDNVNRLNEIETFHINKRIKNRIARDVIEYLLRNGIGYKSKNAKSVYDSFSKQSRDILGKDYSRNLRRLVYRRMAS